MNFKTMSVFIVFVLSMSTASIGATKAQDFKLDDLDGNTISLEALKGKVVLLNFWTTWCPPCRAEIPYFIKFQEKFKDQDFAVIGISLDRKSASEVKKFVNDNNINYPIMMGNGTVTKIYQNYIDSSMRDSIPFTFIIDREGNIAKTYVGSRDEKVFERDILEVLKK